MNAENAGPLCGSTVHVVDSDPALRELCTGLRPALDAELRIYDSAGGFMEQFDPERPGCVLTELRLPDLGGLQLQEQLNGNPTSVPLIFITAHATVPAAVRAMKNGAFDFLQKPVEEHWLCECVCRALQADAEARRARAAWQACRERIETLSSRELEILHAVVSGMSNREIGARLRVSPKTVESHRSNIMKKTNVDGIAQLVRLYLTASARPRRAGSP